MKDCKDGRVIDIERTTLFESAQRGDVEVVKKLLDEYHDVVESYGDGESCYFVNMRESVFGRTALHAATIKGHSDVVKVLLECPTIDVNLVDAAKRTALHMAVGNGRADIVRLLLYACGIHVNAVDGFVRTPLFEAVRDNKVEIAAILLADQRVNAGAWFLAKTPLHKAIDNCNFEMVETLLSSNAGVYVVNERDEKYGMTPLYVAASRGFHDIVQRLLSLENIDVNAWSRMAFTPLHAAARGNHVHTLRALLERDDILVNTCAVNRLNPVSHANSNGSEATVNILLNDARVELNLSDVDMLSLEQLWNAPIRSVSAERMRTYIREHVFMFDEVSTDHMLFGCAKRGELELLREVLRVSNADASGIDYDGRTILHYAVLRDDVQMVRFIVDHLLALDLFVEDKEGATALNIAVRLGHTDMVYMIRRASHTMIDDENLEGAVPMR